VLLLRLPRWPEWRVETTTEKAKRRKTTPRKKQTKKERNEERNEETNDTKESVCVRV
jgi:hypothetical protein